MTTPFNKILHLEGECVETNDHLVALYQKRARELGMSGKTMFYRDEAQHQTKVAQFGALLHDRVGYNDTVLDIGCGYGSLSPLLPNCHYSGIDLVPEFIAYAKQRYNSLDFKILDLAAYESDYDWGILLGVVNSVPYPDKLVALAWSKCKKGLFVDFVDRSKLPDDYYDLNHFDIGNCLTKLLELGARKVEVYPTSNVWTLFVCTKNDLYHNS